jgi:tyrosyl-tRNA synthetase
MKNVIDILKERSFFEAMTSDDLSTVLQNPMKVYCGFDPTSDGLHLGNMVPIMALAWFQKCGHTPVALVGGATGMIGDPSGKAHERSLLDEATIRTNSRGIERDLRQILKGDNVLFVNNYDWFKDLSMVAFLRDVGKYFRIGPMMAKDSVRARLNSAEGMSFTEFSYQLLQGYDFYHLQKEMGVLLQIGGSDQWGNITAGIELVRKLSGPQVYGVTFPLLLRSDGQKFGKSEKGSIWLSKDKLSPYEFYQYLVRVPDADVLMLMRYLTFMDMDEIRKYEVLMQREDYQPNTAQKRLAEEVTTLVHGTEDLQTALRVTAAAAPGSTSQLDGALLAALGADIPSYEIPLHDLLSLSVVDLLVTIGLQPSKGEARKLLRNGGVYLNNQRVEDERAGIEQSQLVDQCYLLVAAGKKNKMLVRAIGKKILPEN